MKHIVVIGTGDFSDLVTDLIEKNLGRVIAGYVVDDEFWKNGIYHNKPVIKMSQLEQIYPNQYYEIAIGFIGNDFQKHRCDLFVKLSSKGYSFSNWVHPSAVISTENIGEGNIIFENCVVGSHAKMGNGNIVWPLASINHHNVVGSFNNISPAVSTSGNVIIGSHCFLGNNSTYKNKVNVADYSLIGAGTYISDDTEKYSVYVPARSKKLSKKSLDFLL